MTILDADDPLSVSCTDAIRSGNVEQLAALLASQRYWGEHRCRRLLRSVQISETKAVGTMTERERLTLAAAINRRGPTQN